MVNSQDLGVRVRMPIMAIPESSGRKEFKLPFQCPYVRSCMPKYHDLMSSGFPEAHSPVFLSILRMTCLANPNACEIYRQNQAKIPTLFDRVMAEMSDETSD